MSKIIWKLTSEVVIGLDIDTMTVVDGIDILVSKEESACRRALSLVMREYIRFTEDLVWRNYERPKVTYMTFDRGSCGHMIHRIEIDENNPFEEANIVYRYFVRAIRVLD